jgi:hypothetical protein
LGASKLEISLLVPIPVGWWEEEAGQSLLPGHMELVLAANKLLAGYLCGTRLG